MEIPGLSRDRVKIRSILGTVADLRLAALGCFATYSAGFLAGVPGLIALGRDPDCLPKQDQIIC